MLDVTLHLLSHDGGRILGFTSHMHPIIDLNDILLPEINVKPFLSKALLGGLNREDDVLPFLPKGETN